MIYRLAASVAQELGKQFPAVLILGPRQCGKTTLARKFLKGTYFDLEKPSDHQIFQGDPELALRRVGDPLILDEAQNLPALFPVIRSLIDEQRERTGRFFLLGSVDPVLVRHISESLAGRVGILELTPFLYPEVRKAGLNLAEHWLRGGYPDAWRAGDMTRWERWQEAYLRTFVERDLPRHGLKASPIEMRRFMTMVAHLHGGLFNASELGRSFGVTYHTTNNYLDILEGHYLIRRLPPYSANIGKRLVKTPKLYVRDSGLLHHLLGIRSERDLLAAPKRGLSWEGWLIEQRIALEQLQRPGSQFSFFRTQAGAEIDLIVERGTERVGYEFKSALSASPADASGLRAGIEAGVVSRGMLVCQGSRCYPMAKDIEVVGAEEWLGAVPQLP